MTDEELAEIRRVVEGAASVCEPCSYHEVMSLLDEVVRLKAENAGFRAFIVYCREWMPDFKNWMFNVWERNKDTMAVLDTIGGYSD